MNADLQLFVEQAIWLAPRLRDPSRLGVMNWICRRLDPEARHALVQCFPLMHPVQIEAERAVCQLLSRAIVVQGERVCRADTVTRSVDWPATYANAFSSVRPPVPYVVRFRQPIPDRACLNSLATLARSWISMLALARSAGASDGVVDIERRRLLLRQSIAPHLSRAQAPCAFSHRHAARLRMLDKEARAQVASIQNALGFWRQLFGGSDTSDADRLRALGRLLQTCDAANIDTLLEATVALSIARAAAQAERADWPTDQPWTIVNIDEGVNKYPSIHLRSKALHCAISKGAPYEVGRDGSRRKVADLLSPWADEALEFTGKPRSTGRQPDLVLTFWLESRPDNVIFVLGDAKRNATGDGEAYLRGALEVAAMYLMSFGYRMGLRLPNPDGGQIMTALTPGVTIFCRQNSGRDAESAIALFRANRPPPVVMAFDLVKHFALGSRPWHSPVLGAWLGSLGRQAFNVLTQCENVGRRRVTRAEAH